MVAIYQVCDDHLNIPADIDRETISCRGGIPIECRYVPALHKAQFGAQAQL